MSGICLFPDKISRMPISMSDAVDLVWRGHVLPPVTKGPSLGKWTNGYSPTLNALSRSDAAPLTFPLSQGTLNPCAISMAEIEEIMSQLEPQEAKRIRDMLSANAGGLNKTRGTGDTDPLRFGVPIEAEEAKHVSLYSGKNSWDYLQIHHTGPSNSIGLERLGEKVPMIPGSYMVCLRFAAFQLVVEALRTGRLFQRLHVVMISPHGSEAKRLVEQSLEHIRSSLQRNVSPVHGSRPEHEERPLYSVSTKVTVVASMREAYQLQEARQQEAPVRPKDKDLVMVVNPYLNTQFCSGMSGLPDTPNTVDLCTTSQLSEVYDNISKWIRQPDAFDGHLFSVPYNINSTEYLRKQSEQDRHSDIFPVEGRLPSATFPYPLLGQLFWSVRGPPGCGHVLEVRVTSEERSSKQFTGQPPKEAKEPVVVTAECLQRQGQYFDTYVRTQLYVLCVDPELTVEGAEFTTIESFPLAILKPSKMPNVVSADLRSTVSPYPIVLTLDSLVSYLLVYYYRNLYNYENGPCDDPCPSPYVVNATRLRSLNCSRLLGPVTKNQVHVPGVDLSAPSEITRACVRQLYSLADRLSCVHRRRSLFATSDRSDPSQIDPGLRLHVLCVNGLNPDLLTNIRFNGLVDAMVAWYDGSSGLWNYDFIVTDDNNWRVQTSQLAKWNLVNTAAVSLNTGVCFKDYVEYIEGLCH